MAGGDIRLGESMTTDAKPKKEIRIIAKTETIEMIDTGFFGLQRKRKTHEERFSGRLTEAQLEQFREFLRSN